MGQYTGKFGGIKYNDSKVNTAKDRLNAAKKELDDTRSAMAQGFTSLQSCRGIEHIQADLGHNKGVILEFPDKCTEYIEILYNDVKSKQEEIEDYRDSPWYKKIFASLCMGVSKVIEGIATVGENIVDAGVSLAGFTAGIFGNKEFKDSCAEFVKKDHVGGFFNDYINGDSTWIGRNSALSPNCGVCKVLKGVGVAAGYIGLAALTGGAAGAMGVNMSATAANTVVAAVGGFGAGTESGLQQGKDFDHAMLQGLKQAAIQGGTAYAAGKLSEGLQNNAVTKAKAQTVADAKATAARGTDFVVGPGGETAVANNLDDAVNLMAQNGDDAAKIMSNTKTLYNNKAYNALENAGKSGMTNVKNVASAAGDKIDDVVGMAKNSNLGQSVSSKVNTIATSKGGQAIGNVAKYGKTVGGDALQLVDDLAKPVTNLAKGGVNLAGKGLQTVDKWATVGGNVIAKAGPGVTNTLAATLVTAPHISTESAKTDMAVQARKLEAKADFDLQGERIFADQISYPSQNESNSVENIETPTEGGSTTSSGSTGGGSTSSGGSSSGGGSTQGNVAYRQSTGGGSSSGGGSSYTPRSSVVDSTVSGVKQETDPTSILNTPSGNKTTTTTTESTTTKPTIKEVGNTEVVKDLITKPSNTTTTTTGNNTTTNPIRSTTTVGSSGTSHSGGGYSSSGYSFSGTDATTTTTTIDPSKIENVESTGVGAGSLASSVTSTGSYKNQTIKIPTTSEAIQTSGSGNNVVIPTAAAFSAAAAAGIGAKAYMDHKENNNNNMEEFSEGEENSGFYSEEWNGTDDDIKIDYGTEEEQTLDDDDNMYSADSIIEKYEATNNQELEEVY